ncbi:Aldo/keto reductase [Gloeopeniophorella convolvens]|nr:Aldo/keto reductase [Gloeopeniophorella convolvens]
MTLLFRQCWRVMPWPSIKLNDGHTIPSIAFGTWRTGSGQDPIDQVDRALSVGFSHIDTAQAYGNEEEAGIALRESGLARKDVFITTKYSGRDGLGIEGSIRSSLRKLGVEYVDLYLIHDPSLVQSDIPAAWTEMEELKKAGLVKSIGVSNFEIEHLEVLLASAKIKPAANQILLHPYVYAHQAPLIAYCAQHGIVTEGYSALIPITQLPGGPLDAPLLEIAKRFDATTDQVLLAWVKAKGAVAVTSSSKKSRLEGYLTAADLELTSDDIVMLDAAGAKGARHEFMRKTARRAIVLALSGAIVFRTYALFEALLS